VSADSVLFLTEVGESSSAWVRSHIPAKGMAKHGWQVCLAGIQFLDDEGRINGAAPAADGKGLGVLPLCRNVVMRRLNESNGKQAFMKGDIVRARHAGQRVYVDLDDDIWSVPEWNPVHGQMSKQDLRRWTEDMRTCNGILVTTKALAEQVRVHLGDSVPVHICHNGVDTSLYEPWKEWGNNADRPLRLGWMGTTDYRGHDLGIVIPALRQVLEGRFREVEFWHYGARPELPSIHDLLGERFPVQVREIPWTSLTRVPEQLVRLDAAIIPQDKHPFNEARSAVSGLQMMAAGVPFVASATEPYRELWRQGGGYAVDNNHATWVQALRMLIDPEYESARRDIRTAGFVLASRYTPEMVANQWEDALHA